MADLESLRAAFRASAPPRDDGHPSSADWEQLACGELGAEAREELLDHVLECPECSDTYRALGIVRSEAAAFDEEVPVSETAPVRFPLSHLISWKGVGALAVAATAILAVVVPLQRGRDAGVETEVVVRSADGNAAVAIVAPIGEVSWRPGDDVRFIWESPSSTGPFVVEVLDSEGEPVWTAPDTEAVETVWPAGGVPGAGSYYWRVFTSDQASNRVESVLVAFDLVSANPP